MLRDQLYNIVLDDVKSCNTVKDLLTINTVKALCSVKGPKFGQCRIYLQKELSTRKEAVFD